jgi:hypothetical protein
MKNTTDTLVEIGSIISGCLNLIMNESWVEDDSGMISVLLLTEAEFSLDRTVKEEKVIIFTKFQITH